eukprot:Clim_evm48s158 gene=Clim_evmTU48s158
MTAEAQYERARMDLGDVIQQSGGSPRAWVLPVQHEYAKGTGDNLGNLKPREAYVVLKAHHRQIMEVGNAQFGKPTRLASPVIGSQNIFITRSDYPFDLYELEDGYQWRRASSEVKTIGNVEVKTQQDGTHDSQLGWISRRIMTLRTPLFLNDHIHIVIYARDFRQRYQKITDLVPCAKPEGYTTIKNKDPDHTGVGRGRAPYRTKAIKALQDQLLAAEKSKKKEHKMMGGHSQQHIIQSVAQPAMSHGPHGMAGAESSSHAKKMSIKQAEKLQREADRERKRQERYAQEMAEKVVLKPRPPPENAKHRAPPPTAIHGRMPVSLLALTKTLNRQEERMAELGIPRLLDAEDSQKTATSSQQPGAKKDLVTELKQELEMMAPTVPEKPRTAMNRFRKIQYRALARKFPHLGVTEVSGEISRLWRELPDDERRKYYRQYEADRMRYEQEIRRYELELKLYNEKRDQVIETAKREARLHQLRSLESSIEPLTKKDRLPGDYALTLSEAIKEEVDEADVGDDEREWTVKHIATARYRKYHDLMFDLLYGEVNGEVDDDVEDDDENEEDEDVKPAEKRARVVKSARINAHDESAPYDYQHLPRKLEEDRTTLLERIQHRTTGLQREIEAARGTDKRYTQDHAKVNHDLDMNLSRIKTADSVEELDAISRDLELKPGNPYSRGFHVVPKPSMTQDQVYDLDSGEDHKSTLMILT